MFFCSSLAQWVLEDEYTCITLGFTVTLISVSVIDNTSFFCSISLMTQLIPTVNKKYIRQFYTEDKTVDLRAPKMANLVLKW